MVVENWLSRRPFSEAILTELTEFEKKEIDIFTETNKLLTTLSTGLIAVVTGFLVNRDQNVTLLTADRRRAIASWAASALSLYFGHLAYRQMLWMLHHRFFNIFSDAVWIPSRIQFWLFLLSAILLADFIYRTFKRKEGGDAPVLKV
jgi:hypothetical protein